MVHFWYLSIGREICSVRVFKTQPKTVFVSSSRASAWNFLREMMSFLGISSFASRGRVKVLIASGTAAIIRSVFPGKSGVIAIVSSI